jgi:hypothetical protein
MFNKGIVWHSYMHFHMLEECSEARADTSRRCGVLEDVTHRSTNALNQGHHEKT